MNNWEAIRQHRERGCCAISHYALRDASGQSVQCGQRPIPTLRMIHIFDGDELVGKAVSLAGGIDGANAILDELLGPVVPSHATSLN